MTGQLKAKVGGSWVPVTTAGSGSSGGGGTDEVWVGPDDPIAATPTIEFWIDTDEPAQLTNDQRWNTAWGIVAIGNPVNNIVELLTQPGEWLTDTITFTPLVGRRYVVKYQVRAIQGARYNVTTTSPGASSTGHIDLYTDGATPALADSWFEVEVAYGGRGFEWLLTGDGVSHTYRIRGVVNGGSLYVHNQPAAGNVYFYIEDMGPVSGSAVVVPSPVTAWANLTLTNGWVVDSVSGFQAPQYRRVGDQVQLRGACQYTGAGTTSPFTMPADCLPLRQFRLGLPTMKISVGTISMARCDINTAGLFNVYEYTPAMTNPVIFLTGVSWSTT